MMDSYVDLAYSAGFLQEELNFFQDLEKVVCKGNVLDTLANKYISSDSANDLRSKMLECADMKGVYGMEGITAYIRLYVPCRVSSDEPDVKCEKLNRTAELHKQE